MANGKWPQSGSLAMGEPYVNWFLKWYLVYKLNLNPFIMFFVFIGVFLAGMIAETFCGLGLKIRRYLKEKF